MTTLISARTSKGHEIETIELDVQGMTCDSCVDSVTRVLQRVPGVAGVDVNLSLGRARVTTSEKSAFLVASLTAALEAAGYPAARAVAAAATPSSDHAHTGGCGHGAGPKKQGGGCCCS